ncbi:MAG: hypothetical protein JO186_06975, partial [Actinobacteria bacterium]|nr:hypothetical protein [Actinomycetota bacterium]
MRPKVALVHPYWDFWEAAVPFDLRADREQFAAAAQEGLDVEWVRPEDAEAVLVLQTMATPPAWTTRALPDLPLVVWAAHRRSTVPETFDHSDITTEGATVGTPMLTSVLVRERRPFELVMGRVEDSAPVFEALRGAAAATRVRRARVARVGVPQDGYACVDTPSALLEEKLGLSVVQIEPREVKEAYDAVSDERAAAMLDETRALYDVQVDGEGFRRSLRAACAIEDLVAAHDLDAGA